MVLTEWSNMQSLVYPVAVVGTVATVLMVVGMLYMVWISMDDPTHQPALDAGEPDAPEVADESA
ncbi:hypothetical protein JCM17823_18380 [Halorubrum gandharaense]